MDVIYEPYTYDELIAQMNANGQVEAMVEVGEDFYYNLKGAEAEEWKGCAGACEELYDELAEMVIGNQWCYEELYWEESDIPASNYGNVVLTVTVVPDLTE